MKYYVYRGIGSSGELTKIGEVTDTKSYTDTGLQPKTIYRYAVSAYNGIRESAKSNIITVTTAEIPVSTITLSITKTSFEVGETAKITVTVTPPNQTSGTPTLASTNTKVATVDNSGNVRAVGVGTTTITASLAGKTSNMLTITVYEALVNVNDLSSSNITATGATLTWE
ncbi:Ig-like domain-containing protein [Ligilactobacillus saerimneri]|uniref:Ig-like domain-containing protein n=1 Tax=Ligilactobacillus saerimneri TaxID=228229 RepID=UPI002942CBE3|nr:Ig-like domain-containing protein [Ligilactobacillus saerimneri]